MVNISLLGTVKFICECLDNFPPSFPVKEIVSALVAFANSIALITFAELPLPLIPIQIYIPMTGMLMAFVMGAAQVISV